MFCHTHHTWLKKFYITKMLSCLSGTIRSSRLRLWCLIILAWKELPPIHCRDFFSFHIRPSAGIISTVNRITAPHRPARQCSHHREALERTCLLRILQEFLHFILKFRILVIHHEKKWLPIVDLRKNSYLQSIHVNSSLFYPDHFPQHQK